MHHSAADDPELRDWLGSQSEHGSNFMRSLADTAKMADFRQYAILRPALLLLRAQCPEPHSIVVNGNPTRAGENERVVAFEVDDLRPQQFSSIEAIREVGFDGFVAISALQSTECAGVPDVPGVYLVLKSSATTPEFLEESTGGHFKGKNPTVPISVLQSEWVQGAIVLYIGKAGPTVGRTLKTRLIEYMRFGRGVPIGHSGGRYIWQLTQSGDLLVCWRETNNADPRGVEKELIRDFEGAYGKIPFANGRH